MDMSSRASTSGRAARSLAMALAIGMVATLGLVALPRAQGALIAFDVDPGLYTGTNRYVPTEVMKITITATPGDVYDLTILDFVTGTPSASINGQTVGASGVKTIQWTVPTSWPDGGNYRVELRVGGGGGGPVRTYRFSIQEYTFTVRTDRGAYLPGDTVTVSWSAVLIKDGSPAPAGDGEIQAYDGAGVSLLTPVQYNFTASEGFFRFTLSPTVPSGQRPWVYGWFNDTAGLRQGYDTARFNIDDLGVIVSVQRAVYAPGEIVTVDIHAKITNNPGNPSINDPGAAGVTVNVTVNDLVSGNPVDSYGKTGLLADAHGDVTYVFQLASTPTTGSYEVSVTATAHGTLSATSTDTFDVQQTTAMSVSLTFDKGQYLSGETVVATATVFRTTPGTYVFTWTVEDASTGNLLAQGAGAFSSFIYNTTADYSGSLRFRVTVNDGEGNTATDTRLATVAFGYLAVSLDRSQYTPGETVTATFSLVHGSQVLTNPTYYYEVRDAGGATQASGSVAGNSASYPTPSPASPSYTFYITASQDGRTVQGSATAYRADGFLLSITLDKASYLRGETIQIHYTITPRGTSVLPQQFHFTAALLGGIGISATTTSPTGDLLLPVPAGTDEGNLLLYVADSATGTYVYETVHIGPTNALYDTTIGGIPLFDVLLGLVVILLAITVLFLWRRTSAGGVGRPPAAKPAPPPPPPGPVAAPTGPMSVSCTHCGKPIEITTSKRPIEVMCPSCGETQLVQ